MDKDSARAQILLSGSGDFVSLAEAAGYVRDDLPEASADAVKAETLTVIAELATRGLIRIGELTHEFSAWDPDTAITVIDERWTKPDHELAPWDGVWLANTPPGDRLADELADDGKTTRP